MPDKNGNPYPHEIYIATNQVADEAIALRATLPTNLYTLIWAAFVDGFILPSMDAVPEGLPVPTVDDDIAALKAWAQTQLREAVVVSAARINAELQRKRAQAEAEQRIGATLSQLESTVTVEIVE